MSFRTQRVPMGTGLPLLLVLAVPIVSGCKGRERASAVRGGGDTTVAAAPGAIANAPAQQPESATTPSAAAPTPAPAKAAPAKPATSKQAAAKPAPPETTASAAPAAETGAAAAPPAEPPFTFDPKKSASALGVYAYPQKSQSSTQQQRDENECFAWAQKQTGIDFYAIAPTGDTTATTKKGGTVKGAARGAAAGAAIGAIAGDAGTGAGVGAVGGAIAGRRQQKGTEQATKQQAEQQAASEVGQQEQTFRNAFSACMQGRNYSVK